MRFIQWIISVVWLAAIVFALITPRSDFLTLFSFYSVAFATYIFLVFNKRSMPLMHGLLIAFACRLIAFFFEPLLSDDYFRFVWDGMVMHEGYNPAAYPPSYLYNHPETGNFDERLFLLLNSKDYYSVYPPLAQLFFYISYSINQLNLNGHILFYKTVLLFADIIILHTLSKLLKRKNLSVQAILIYALNPLIIIEYSGNLHMESIMIAALLAAIVFAEKGKWFLSSFFMTLSICSKLLTLVLMPFMPREMYWKRMILWGLLTIFLSAGIFLLMFRTNYGWMGSIGLWFSSFEFNASIYYIVQQFHSAFLGYENIKVVGPVMAVATFILIVITWWFYLRKKQIYWSSAMLFVLTIYFLMTTTLHPWYLGILLILSVMSGHRYPVIWTYLVFLSYSHYADNRFSEKHLYIICEYFLLFTFMFFEFIAPVVRQAIKKPLL